MAVLPVYKSFSDKAANFKVEKIDTLENVSELRFSHENSLGIYRGINSSAYKIFTSLQRQIILNDLSGRFSLEAYINGARQHNILKRYFETLQIAPSKLSIYSLLQHYGAPTPFLDFTTSFEKALYFAIENFDQSKFVPDKTIGDYFSIFFIEKDDLELLSIPEVISGLKELKEVSRKTLSHYEDFSEQSLVEHIDTIMSIRTCEVFLINYDKEFAEVYNTYNNIRIIAQNGLFIHNNYPDLPLEVALKEFFKDATRYQVGPWDEINTEQSRAINEEYRETLERNRGYQKRLENNIIKSYEINKLLIPEIKKTFLLRREDIYPNFEDMFWGLFEHAKGK
jgi:hypothetical protein